MNKAKLKDLRQQGFDKWFSAWWREQRLEVDVIVAAREGQDKYRINCKSAFDKTKEFWMTSNLFEEALRLKFPDLQIIRHTEYKWSFWYSDIVYKTNEIVLSWED